MHRWVVASLRVGLVIAAGWALRRELVGLRLSDLGARLGAYGFGHVALGLACTVASFLVLGIVERLALRHAAAGDAVPTARALGASFVANAFSQSVGLALLTGAAVRLRAYARDGLDAVAVARVSAYVTLTATLGLLAAGAAALLASPAPLRLHGLALGTRPLGAVLGAIVVAYLAWSLLGRGDAVGRGRWRLPRPAFGLALAQVALSAFDWLLTGTVLFAFLPAALGVGYWALLRAYMIAQTVGVTSHVPAGAGVLELVLIALLAASTPMSTPAHAAVVASLVASLVMFRVVYYLAPLVVAMLLAGAAELRRPAARPALVEARVG